jgi:hypothetical protein
MPSLSIASHTSDGSNVCRKRQVRPRSVTTGPHTAVTTTTRYQPDGDSREAGRREKRAASTCTSTRTCTQHMHTAQARARARARDAHQRLRRGGCDGCRWRHRHSGWPRHRRNRHGGRGRQRAVEVEVGLRRDVAGRRRAVEHLRAPVQRGDD